VGEPTEGISKRGQPSEITVTRCHTAHHLLSRTVNFSPEAVYLEHSFYYTTSLSKAQAMADVLTSNLPLENAKLDDFDAESTSDADARARDAGSPTGEDEEMADLFGGDEEELEEYAIRFFIPLAPLTQSHLVACLRVNNCLPRNSNAGEL